MEIIFKKKSKGAIKNRYSFPTTDEMKSKLDGLKLSHDVDINEMFRAFAQKIIEDIEAKKSA